LVCERRKDHDMTDSPAHLSKRGVSSPACRDTRYVTDLVAPGVVNTMPEAAFRRLGR
jgi:hypothetical protein